MKGFLIVLRVLFFKTLFWSSTNSGSLKCSHRYSIATSSRASGTNIITEISVPSETSTLGQNTNTSHHLCGHGISEDSSIRRLSDSENWLGFCLFCKYDLLRILWHIYPSGSLFCPVLSNLLLWYPSLTRVLGRTEAPQESAFYLA